MCKWWQVIPKLLVLFGTSAAINMKKACSLCGAQQENEDVAANRNPSFLKKMATSSMSSLRLPLSFVRDQIDNLDNIVILEGPGKGKWKVELQGSFQSFSLNFGQGWAKFVADHVLQIDDLLTFSLSAKYYFQVEVCNLCRTQSALCHAVTTSSGLRSFDFIVYVAAPSRFTMEVGARRRVPLMRRVLRRWLLRQQGLVGRQGLSRSQRGLLRWQKSLFQTLLR